LTDSQGNGASTIVLPYTQGNVFLSLPAGDLSEDLEEEGKKRKKDDGAFEEVAQESDLSDDSDAQAEALAMGTLMLRKKQKQALIESTYNRFAWDDPENLPEWFKDDQAMNNRPILPVTKEQVDQFKEKLKAINARPLRKMVEAKARKKMRALKRWERTKSKADAIANSEGGDEGNKLRQIQKLYKKADKTKIKGPPVYIVAKKGGGSVTVKGKGKGGQKGGARGKVKRVDRRLKKDLRAEKRAAKRKGTKGKGSRKR